MSDLYEKILETKIRGLTDSRKTNFIDALIGFVCRADSLDGNWEITCEQFDAKLRDLQATFGYASRVFPSLKRILDAGDLPAVQADEPFIRKIQEIQHTERIDVAIQQYQATVQTIREEFEHYRVEEDVLRDFEYGVIQRFEMGYAIACSDCEDEIKHSRRFYDRTMMEPPPSLSLFDDTPDWFRNGLLHTKMNDSKLLYKWKLDKNTET
ncbi:hypothetical protein BKK80_12030 [Cupriavidus malaysiensis]|uniref:Uncharacterized protein n=2 Tax=Cupriavidus malaysiensis TaxID=367825 RepID=A0ABN4TH50_9BURK|nr:hypothetical protein BKK80_12030 [Cupriavidus malaysiensis]